MLPWTILEEQFPVRNVAASIIGNGIIWLLWQLRCYCNPDHNKFSSLSNTTVVAIFPNVCLWCRSLCSKKTSQVLTLKNCIEPPSYASTAYVVASYGPRFCSTVFVKIWATYKNFLGKWFTAPPWQKIARTPMIACHQTFLSFFFASSILNDCSPLSGSRFLVFY